MAATLVGPVTTKTILNRYRIVVLVGLNLLILVHAWAWFVLG
jgi:CHASE3 domain sensor protein